MKNLIIFIFCLSFAIPLSAISLSLASDVNTYMQVYDSFGAIIFADFVIPNDTPRKVETGAIQIDRVRWIGIDKKIYEYRFDNTPVTDRIVFQISKNNVCTVGKIGQTGMIESAFPYKGTVIY